MIDIDCTEIGLRTEVVKSVDVYCSFLLIDEMKDHAVV